MRRWLLVVLAIAVLLAVPLGAFEFWLYSTFHTFNPYEPPPLIRIWGGLYRRAGTNTLSQVRASTESEPQILEPTFAMLPLELPREPTGGTIGTRMVLWLQVGPDTYVGYLRAGGP